MNAREVITEELRHMGSFIPHVEANNIIYRLRIAGFVIIPRSEVEEKDREIAALREALREAAAALDQAREDVACWGSYAGEYFQDKHDLEGDLDRLAKQASAAHRALEGGENG